MVMAGPRSWMDFHVSHAPMSAATMGMIQMGENRRRFSTTIASGTSPVSRMPGSAAIPDEARIEGLRGDHGEDDHAPEEKGAGARLDLGQRSHLHQGGEDGDDVDVDHRPSPHDLGQ